MTVTVPLRVRRWLLAGAWAAVLLDLLVPAAYPAGPLQRARGADPRALPTDASGLYAVERGVWRGDADAAAVNATLATHLTPQHLLASAHALGRWAGRGSVAVFVPDAPAYAAALDALHYLHACHPAILARTDYHFVYLTDPRAYDKALHWHPPARPRCRPLSADDETLPAHPAPDPSSVDTSASASAAPNGAAQRANYAQTVPYPNNMLRNVAVAAARTDVVAVLDADMVPSPSLAAAALALLEREDPRAQVALVAPAFEIKSSPEVPTHKTELLAMLEAGDAEPFYVQLCAKCQNTTDYARWARTPPGAHATYSMTWKDPWEPLYISRRSVTPPYDERFKQYGFNRISQVCEMHIAGFDFRVLTDEFVVHPGFKIPTRSFHASKEEEQQRNRMLFRTFKKELKTKYPGVARRCY